MAKAGKPKLKRPGPPRRPATRRLRVFRTPIGFHDAYVAADTNLFAAGAAEPVTEAELMKVPLGRPGEVIKVLRGTKAEQVAALGKVAGGAGKKKAGPRVKPGVTKKKQKPSREALERAEEQLAKLEREQAKELAEIDKEIDAIERRRRELERRRRELGEFEEKAERERARYERELESWKNG